MSFCQCFRNSDVFLVTIHNFLNQYFKKLDFLESVCVRMKLRSFNNKPIPSKKFSVLFSKKFSYEYDNQGPEVYSQ